MFGAVAQVRGLLNADIIGFHSFDHARNFLTACTRLLGLTYSVRKVRKLGSTAPDNYPPMFCMALIAGG